MAASFLHTASAKIVAEMLHENQSDIFPDSDGRGGGDNGPHDALVQSLRLLLVEEEMIGANHSGECMGSLARSLAMDVAYSLVSSSSTPCRGCSKAVGGGNETSGDTGAQPTTPTACHCCRVALLIPGEPNKPKKKRRRNGEGSNYSGDTGKATFPMPCIREGMGDDERWDPTLLGHIQIKYVDSLTDVIRYLAYAPSLPEHLQPLDGILLIGVGQLLSSQNKSMELTHLLSMLSDTASALEDRKRQLLELQNEVSNDKYYCGEFTVLATIDNATYSSIPPKVTNYFHQWIDITASIGLSHSDVTTDHGDVLTSWELMFKNTGILEILPGVSGNRTAGKTSFGFKVILQENASAEQGTWSLYKIVWRV